MTTPRLYLIDGSGYIFRAYHALPPLTRKSDGLPIGAVSGFCNMLWKFLNEVKGDTAPTHLGVVFDASERTFRTEIDPNYKAHRPPAPDDLVQQFPIIREATAAFGVSCLELAGYEADDIIAAYACRARESGAQVVIVSSDKDLMQLVGDHVAMLDPIKQTLIGREQVLEKFGVEPEKVIDVQALVGDSVDNVPGAPGIGIKTASALINEFGDLDTLLERAGEIKQQKRRETLIDYADQIRLSRRLVTLDCDTPLPAPLEELRVREPDGPALHAFLERMEFKGLSRRIAEGRPAQPAVKPWVEPGARALAEPQAIDPRSYPVVRDLQTLDDWVAGAMRAGVIGLDAETDALSAANAHLQGVSLAVGPGQACFIPMVTPEGLELESEGPPMLGKDEALARLKPLLEHPGVLKVAFNSKYDLAVLAREGVAVAPIDDPMLMSYALEGGLHGHGLAELSKLHLGHEPLAGARQAASARAQKTLAAWDLGQGAAAEDADIALRLHAVLRPKLREVRVLSVYETLERPLPQVLSAMEAEGVAVDPDRLRRLSQTFGTRIAELETEAHALAGRSFGLGSPKQLGELLFDEQGLPGGKRTATGQWVTDAQTLEDLAAQGHALPKAVLEHRQLSKLKGTYTDALTAAIHPRTGRVHTTFHLAASTTGRLSSSDPNLQNIPIRTEIGRGIRQAFVAAPGHKLISADYSQIELRLLAHMGDIPELKRAFAQGLDIHAATASEMFGVPVEGMPAETRRRAKAINFGIVYGISAFGLSNQLGIDQSEAGAYIKAYFERFPGIRVYMDGAKEYVRRYGYVQTLFGRKVHVPDIRSKSAAQRQFAERAAINAPIQGTAADIIRRAMIRMPAALAGAGLRTRMLLQVHDELVFEAPDCECEAAIAAIRPVMERAADPAVALSVPLVVDARAALNWDEAH
ncbi:MAG: DNA polymerase I [Proteobacteria bacterium]|nr:DNA polymerase I [Pseudomonadota bacterium]